MQKYAEICIKTFAKLYEKYTKHTEYRKLNDELKSK